MIWKTLLLLVFTTFSSISASGYAYFGYYPNIHGKGVVPITQVPEPLRCHTVCVKSGLNIGYCYGATYNYYTETCYLHLDKNEMCMKRYWTRNLNAQGMHMIHFPIDECPQSQANAIHGQERALGTGLCLAPAFRPFANIHSLGGTLQTMLTDQLACITACLADNNCWAADFDTRTNECYYHATSITATLQLPLAGVNQWLKICPSVFTNVNPFNTQSTTVATTSAGTTTQVSSGTSTIIGEDGICPSPFELLPNSTLTGGTAQAATVNTTELCKAGCLAAATCLAADFNMETNICTFHTAIDLTMLNRGSQSCCNHYRKLTCTTTRECYTGPSGAVPLTTAPATAAMTFYVTDPSAATATKVTCTGMCFTRIVTAQATASPLSLTNTVSRGCDTTVTFQNGFVCPNSTTTTGTAGTAGYMQTTDFFCSDNLCNILTRTEVRDQLLYLPFDMSILDESGYMRDGYFWNWTMGEFQYDSFDKKKDKAAIFSGQEMVCAPLNYVAFNPTRPEITITSWVKRTGTSPALMGVYSKGVNNTKVNSTESFKLTSTFSAPNLHFYTFSIFLDKEYQCSTGTFMINQYQFVAARVAIGTANPMIELYVVDNPTAATALPTTPTVTCMIDASQQNAAIPVNQDPFCVGGLYVNEKVTPLEGSTSFFTGLLDEIRVFGSTTLNPDGALLAIFKNVD